MSSSTFGACRGSAGASLVELLTAMLVAGVFLAALASLLGTFSDGTRDVIRRVDEAQALRTVWVVLEEELAAGRQGIDWALDGEHAISLRAFRGLARVLGEGSAPGRWRVEWVGHRAPDPARDSLLVLTSEGAWVPASLLATAGPGVPTLPDGLLRGGRVSEWEWTPTGSGAPVLARVFESGRYSLEEHAFRYRRGASGRQPLTPELFSSDARFASEEGGIRVHLEFLTGAPATWWLPGAR